jgi:hypothetical protein
MRSLILCLSVALLFQSCGNREATPANLDQSKIDISKVTRDNFQAQFEALLDTTAGTVRFENIVGQFTQSRFGLSSWSFSVRVPSSSPDVASSTIKVDYTHRALGQVILSGASKDTWRESIQGDGTIFGSSQLSYSAFALPLKIDLEKTGLDSSMWALLEARMSSKKIEGFTLESLDDQKTLAKQMVSFVSDDYLKKTSKEFPFYYSVNTERFIGIAFSTPQEGELNIRMMRLERGKTKDADVLLLQSFRLKGI